jgi:hypothetical protein
MPLAAGETLTAAAAGPDPTAALGSSLASGTVAIINADARTARSLPQPEA